jgi:hypothetical protein
MNLHPQMARLTDGGPVLIFDRSWLIQSTASFMIRFRGQAMESMQRGTPDGEGYKTFARGYHEHTGTLLIYSRDEGMHTSGWWKNPDYERCRHLSLSFYEIDALGRQEQVRPKDPKLTERWVQAFFGSDRKWLWCEPPVTEHGKAFDVWHYRLFCDKLWLPIKPRGEVYTREFTEAGWKSYSDVQEARQQAENQ